jgi:allantoicase
MVDVNLAARALGGAVVWANDEFFGMKENLVTDAPPTFRPHTFNLKGQIVDGWETRRRRERSASDATAAAETAHGHAHGHGHGHAHGHGHDAHDSAIIRLGAPGLISGVTVDTSFFVGNFPPECSVEAVDVRGYPSPQELLETEWVTIVSRQKLEGDAENHFAIESEELARRRFTHVRLNNIPDGGIARLRVHGRVLADPEFTVGAGFVQCDLASARNGGRVVATSSNAVYSPATAVLLPGESRVMGEGWETVRRRDSGNDWIEVELIGEGIARFIEIDTANYVGNAPDRVTLRGRVGNSGSGSDSDSGSGSGSDSDSAEWFDLVPETRVQPDTLHRFRIEDAGPATHVRLDTFPDGGVARLRVHGELTERGAAEVIRRWDAAAQILPRRRRPTP